MGIYQATGGDVDSDSILIQPQDLSTVDAEDDGLYLHDGSASITLADGSTTSNVGYYRWDASADGWRQIAQDADTVDGFHGDQLAKVAGDTFEGPVRLDTDTEDALLEQITGVDSQYYPTQLLGEDPDNGMQIQFEPDTDMGRIGSANAGTFTNLISVNQADENLRMNRVREINIGSFDADDYESVFRVYRNGSLVGYIDQSASDLRFKAWSSTADAKVINTNNNGISVTPNDRISFGGNDIGDMPSYSDDTAPPADTLFWDSADGQLEYNDPNGTNHVLG